MNRILSLSLLVVLWSGCSKSGPTDPGQATNQQQTNGNHYGSDPIYNLVAVLPDGSDGSRTNPYSYNITLTDIHNPKYTYWTHVDSGPDILKRVSDGRGVTGAQTHADSTRVFFSFGAQYVPSDSQMSSWCPSCRKDVFTHPVGSRWADSVFKGNQRKIDTNVVLKRWGRLYSLDLFVNTIIFDTSSMFPRMRLMCPDTVLLHGKKYKTKVVNNLASPLVEDSTYPSYNIPQEVFYCNSLDTALFVDSGFVRISNGSKVYFNYSDFYSESKSSFTNGCSDTVIFETGLNPINFHKAPPNPSKGEMWPISSNNPHIPGLGGFFSEPIFCTVDTKYAD